MKLLVIDDDPFSRRLTASAVERLGHETREAETGVTGLEMFRRESFQVVLLDWMMEGMNGLELCHHLRQVARTSYPYLIMVTELRGREHQTRGMAAGADDFLSKPVDVEDLAMRLQVAERIVQLQQRVVQLERLLPMCSYCRKVREVGHEWKSIESYLADHSCGVTHGICPSCMTVELSRLND